MLTVVVVAESCETGKVEAADPLPGLDGDNDTADGDRVRADGPVAKLDVAAGDTPLNGVARLNRRGVGGGDSSGWAGVDDIRRMPMLEPIISSLGVARRVAACRLAAAVGKSLVRPSPDMGFSWWAARQARSIVMVSGAKTCCGMAAPSGAFSAAIS